MQRWPQQSLQLNGHQLSGAICWGVGQPTSMLSPCHFCSTLFLCLMALFSFLCLLQDGLVFHNQAMWKTSPRCVSHTTLAMIHNMSTCQPLTQSKRNKMIWQREFKCHFWLKTLNNKRYESFTGLWVPWYIHSFKRVIDLPWVEHGCWIKLQNRSIDSPLISSHSAMLAKKRFGGTCSPFQASDYQEVGDDMAFLCVKKIRLTPS